MRFVDTPVWKSYLIELDRKEDERGYFCRLFCSQIFQEHGIHGPFVQVNSSYNTKKGTLRGLHYQAPPFLESKVVLPLRGSVYDVIVDLREESPTYLQHYAIELSAREPAALYIPAGCAHGFLTLQEESHLLYFMSTSYRAGCERGFRYDDPAFGIVWPFQPYLISQRDQEYLPFEQSHVRL